MIKQEVRAAFFEHMKNEIFSSYLYDSMATWFNAQGLTGFEKWFDHHAVEEHKHYSKFKAFARETRTPNIEHKAIEGPKNTFSSPVDAFKYTVQHEMFVTKSIQDLHTLAEQSGDKETVVFLQQFLMEQVEELDLFTTILQRIELAGGGLGLIIIDKELGESV